MRCYCYETDTEFFFCVEDVKNAKIEAAIQHMAWRKTGEKFVVPYSQNAFSNQREKELIGSNFSRLGQAMFESSLSGFDWKKPLELIAQKFNESGIEWYIVGSVGDAIRGADVKPFDMDIVVHTRDYCKAKDVCYHSFPDSVIAPFAEKEEINPLRYFGRLFLAGTMIEVAADEAWNLENRQQGFGGFPAQISKYEKTSWNGHDMYLESLQLRYQIEKARNRKDRVKALKKYFKCTKGPRN
jgi:hypothetical protein